VILHGRFLVRELAQTGKQGGIFVLCVALSLTTLVALNSLKGDVHRIIQGDARTLQGGDIILHSHYAFSPSLLQAVSDLQQQQVRGIRVYELYSILRSAISERTLFSRLKIVGPGYPLYGQVLLRSGRPFTEVLSSGRTIVAQEVLDRLGLQIGDSIHVGSIVLVIADVVTHEPDRPMEVFSLGPRVFVAMEDLDRLQLISRGSRVEYGMLLKVDQDDATITAMAARLTEVAQKSQERVSTYRTARSGMKRFFDNLFFFLSLISIFTLFLAGIGMQSSLAALLREKEKTHAIIKAVGGTTGFLFRYTFTLVIFLGLLGSLVGIASGLILKQFLPSLLAGLIPKEVVLAFSIDDIVTGLLLGLLIVLLFTFLPLYNLRNIRPIAIFRNDIPKNGKGFRYYLVVISGLLFLTGLVVRQLQDLKTGLYCMAAIFSLVMIISLLTRFGLIAVRKIPLTSLRLRQAWKSLFRPGNATQPTIVTLASALSVLLTMYLVETNLRATYIDSYPSDAPNLFFLDIQPDQREGFSRTVGSGVELFPVIRARLVSINAKPVKEQPQSKERGDSLTREFNLTYRDTILDDEVVRDGTALFRKDARGKLPLQVSILDTVSEMGDIHLQDILEFNIQGVPLQAKVTSIRTRTKSRLYPFFYFVFPEEYLRDAPQTFFAALHIQKEDISALENRIITAFPNISFINMAETAAELGNLTRRLTTVVTFFAGFSILAGGLILIGSILTTRLARIREAVYYRILGSTSFFVLVMFFYEHLLLGLFSSLLAVILSQAGSWVLCKYLFEIPFTSHWGAGLAMVLITVMLVTVVGLVSSIGIIRQKPVIVLREQNNE
jgi:putative ABC transport system permease protein